MIVKVMSELTPRSRKQLRRIARKLGRGRARNCAPERLKKETRTMIQIRPSEGTRPQQDFVAGLAIHIFV